MIINLWFYLQTPPIGYVSPGSVRSADEAVLGVREGATADIHVNSEGGG